MVEAPFPQDQIDELTEALNVTYADGNLDAARSFATQISTLTAPHTAVAPASHIIALNNLARIEHDLGEAVLAAARFESALQVHQRSGMPPDSTTAASHSGIGRIARERRDYPLAETHFRAALQIEQTFDATTDEYASALNDLASVLYCSGRVLESEPLYRESLRLTQSLHGVDHYEHATGLNNLALTLEELGRYQEASALLVDAVNILENQPDPEVASQLAAYLHHLAGIYRLCGRFDDSLQYFRRALSLREAQLAADHPLRADTLNDLALLHENMGQFALAEQTYQRALQIYEASADVEPERLGAVLNNLGGVYDSQRLWAQAEAAYRRAQTLLSRHLGARHPSVAAVMDNLGGVLARQGHRAQASAALRQALEIRLEHYGPRHPDVARSLNNLGVFCLQDGNISQSEQLLREALQMRCALLGEKHPHVAQSLMNLAKTLCVAGKHAGALELMEQAADIYDTFLVQALYLHSDAQRLAFIDTVSSALSAHLGLLADQAIRSPDAVTRGFEHTVRRLRLSAEAFARQRLLSAGAPVISERLEDLRNVRAEIARCALSGALDPTLAARAEALEAELAAHPSAQTDDARHRILDIDTASLLEKLDGTTCLIQFVRIAQFDPARVDPESEGRFRYLAFVARPASEPAVALVDLGPAEPIESQLNAYLDAILGTTRVPALKRGAAPVLEPMPTDQGTYRMREATLDGLRHFSAAPRASGTAPCALSRKLGMQLRECLFDPLQPAIANSQRLIVAPDGELFRLPFESLPTGSCDHLGDRLDISYLSVGRDLLRDFGLNPCAAPLVVADPDFDLAQVGDAPALPGYPFAPLPGARKEGEAVARTLGVSAITDARATKTLLASQRSPQILHLATHGFFLDVTTVDPSHERIPRLASHPLLRSGLALAGANTWLQGGLPPSEAKEGLLTAMDVAALDLSGTEIVVLSACETALGEILTGEGVYGLSRAFVLAGARALIMSLWRVDDDITRELMAEFYRLHAMGHAAATALVAARRALKQRHPDVRDWAAFICQGAPSAATRARKPASVEK